VLASKGPDFDLKAVKMGNSSSKIEPSPSPTIAVSLEISPSRIRFLSPTITEACNCDRPRLIFTFTNPTPYHITFNLAQTPPHVARHFRQCAGVNGYQPFNITDLDTSAEIPIKTINRCPPYPFPVAADSVKLDPTVYFTIPPGKSCDSTDFDPASTLTAGHSYIIRMSDFYIDACDWDYGRKDATLMEQLQNEHKARAARGRNEYIHPEWEAVGKYWQDRSDGQSKGKLNFKLVGGAVFKTKCRGWYEPGGRHKGADRVNGLADEHGCIAHCRRR
jgi:hypothetical protein